MTTHALAIRAVSAADRDDVLNIALAAGIFPPDGMSEVAGILDEHLAGTKPGDPWLLGELNGRPVAVAYLAAEAVTDGTWNLLMLAVHPDHQGQGHGASLVGHVEKLLRDAGERVLIIETSGVPSFASQRAFYARLGYEEEARIRDFYTEGDDKVVFWKKLTATHSDRPQTTT